MVHDVIRFAIAARLYNVLKPPQFYFKIFFVKRNLYVFIVAEYLRMKKNPSVLRACRITTQKFLYFLVFLASILRGTYFAAPVSSVYKLCRLTTEVILVSVGHLEFWADPGRSPIPPCCERAFGLPCAGPRACSAGQCGPGLT